MIMKYRLSIPHAKSLCWAGLFLLAGLPMSLPGQPKPGDVFREYLWTNEKGDAGGSLRVGGKQG